MSHKRMIWVLAIALFAGCGGGSSSGGSGGGGGITISITGLDVTPAAATLQAGGSIDFTATGTYSDGTTALAPVTWDTDDPAVAIVDPDGTASTFLAGTVTVTATSDEDPSITATAPPAKPS